LIKQEVDLKNQRVPFPLMSMMAILFVCRAPCEGDRSQNTGDKKWK